MDFFGIGLVGINAENGHKLLLTLLLLTALAALTFVLRLATAAVLSGERFKRASFWTRQGISLFAAVALVIGLASIWFDDPTRLTTALGLMSAGLAFALQKVVTSLAGYFVILRGNNFTVGDRITMPAEGAPRARRRAVTSPRRATASAGRARAEARGSTRRVCSAGAAGVQGRRFAVRLAATARISLASMGFGTWVLKPARKARARSSLRA